MALDENEFDDLRRQVRELTDRAQITDLVTRLGVWLDGHCQADPSALFTADIVAATPGGVDDGLDVVVEQARRAHAGYERLQHFTSNVLVEPDGDRASVRANLVAVFITGGEQPGTRVMVGNYRFVTARTPAGWRIARLEILPSWTSEVQHAALIPARAA